MWLLAIAGGYVLVVGAVWALQRSMIYLPSRLEGEPRGTRAGAEVVQFAAPGGPQVFALYARPPNGTAPVAVIFHGNAGNLETWAPTLAPWVRAGCGALLLDPRGYGWSEGSPSEEGWLADGEAAIDFLESRGVLAERLVLHGISIGSGIAVPTAAKRKVKGLVLDSPFTSLCDAAQAAYPFLPCRLLLRDRYDNLTAASGVTCPVLVLHGDEDGIVPVAQGRRLAGAFPRSATLRVMERTGHNDLSLHPGYDAAISQFVRSLP